MFFIEIHECETNKPVLLNVSHIVSVMPDRAMKRCMILCRDAPRWLSVSESYEEVCAMVGYKE